LKDIQESIGSSILTVLFFSLLVSSFMYIKSEDISLIVFGGNSYSDLLRWASLEIFSAPILGVMLFIQRAKREVIKFVQMSVAVAVLKFLLILYFFYYLKEGEVGIVKGGSIAYLIVVIFFIRKYIVLIHKFSVKKVKKMLRFGAPLGVSEILISIGKSSDKWIISYFLGLGLVGIYDVATKIANVVSLIVSSIQKSWIGNAYEYKKEESYKSSVETVGISYVNFVGALSIAVVVLLYLFQGYILSEEYEDVLTLVGVMSISILVYSVYNIIATTLLLAEKTLIVAKYAIVSTISSAALNFLLVPIIGVIGATLALLIPNLIIFFWSYTYSKLHFSVDYNAIMFRMFLYAIIIITLMILNIVF
jgi:O-antigen/teichoic acid export membrane protein